MATRSKRQKRKLKRYPDILQWLPGVSGVLLALAVASGGFFVPGGPSSWLWFLLGSAFCLLSVFTIARLIRPGELDPVLRISWIPLLWLFYLFVFPVLPQFIVIPALYCAWLGVSLPLPLFLVAAAGLLFMEGGLFFGGNHDLAGVVFNLAAVLSAWLGLFIFVRSRVHRRRMRIEVARRRRYEAIREQAMDLGLEHGSDSLQQVMAEAVERAPEESYREQTVENISRGFDLLLELLRRSLGLTTVAILWSRPGGSDELRLRYLASSRGDIDPGPYPSVTGICGGLGPKRPELSIAPVRTSRTVLPYYHDNNGVGGAVAMLIPRVSDDMSDRYGIICADREDESPWTEAELDSLRLAARHLGRDVEMGRMLLRMDRERGNIQLLCLGLNNLNHGLGLDSVLDEAVRAVRNLIPADFVVITLFEEGGLVNVRADGRGEDDLSGLAFGVDQGLVGRVFRDGIILPAGCRHRGNVPVFAAGDKVGVTPSLICLPLKNEADQPLGVITVGAEADGVFTRERRDILELISTQVAVKIDLGRAHEKINRLASTDPLTGLANRRTLEHGIEVMLERAARLRMQLAVIMVDIDHFKQVNDTYGHACGDVVLLEVARNLGQAVRHVDLAARFGGEEFSLVLENTDRAGAKRLAERIREAVAALEVDCEADKITVTISMGIAVFPDHGDGQEDLLTRADQALYEAKESGRNRVVVYSDS